jgi:hypothetical protein
VLLVDEIIYTKIIVGGGEKDEKIREVEGEIKKGKKQSEDVKEESGRKERGMGTEEGRRWEEGKLEGGNNGMEQGRGGKENVMKREEYNRK